MSGAFRHTPALTTEQRTVDQYRKCYIEDISKKSLKEYSAGAGRLSFVGRALLLFACDRSGVLDPLNRQSLFERLVRSVTTFTNVVAHPYDWESATPVAAPAITADEVAGLRAKYESQPGWLFMVAQAIFNGSFASPLVGSPTVRLDEDYAYKEWVLLNWDRIDSDAGRNELFDCLLEGSVIMSEVYEGFSHHLNMYRGEEVAAMLRESGFGFYWLMEGGRAGTMLVDRACAPDADTGTLRNFVWGRPISALTSLNWDGDRA
jgi:hypothetical protein